MSPQPRGSVRAWFDSREGCRLEYREGTSSKFWQAMFEPTTGTWLVEWGRIGRPAQAQQAGLSRDDASGRAEEKLRKGYFFAGTPLETIESSAALADARVRPVAAATVKTKQQKAGLRRIVTD
jgi:predicted DNA-binding WGR domain protein